MMTWLDQVLWWNYASSVEWSHDEMLLKPGDVKFWLVSTGCSIQNRGGNGGGGNRLNPDLPGRRVYVFRNYCWKIQSRTSLPMSTMRSVRRRLWLVAALIDDDAFTWNVLLITDAQLCLVSHSHCSCAVTSKLFWSLTTFCIYLFSRLWTEIFCTKWIGFAGIMAVITTHVCACVEMWLSFIVRMSDPARYRRNCCLVEV